MIINEYGIRSVSDIMGNTCFKDGDYCDFKLKVDAKPITYWPPVFTQGKGYK